MPKLHVIIVSTRPGRVGPSVAAWFDTFARQHGRFDVRLVDLAEVNLPLFDEPNHPRHRQYQHEHTKRWSAIVAEADAFAFVMPEYNFSAPPSFVNAIDFLFHEWSYKPVCFVSYGGTSGGLRAVQMAKQLATAVKMMPLQETVAIPFVVQHRDDTGAFKATDSHERAAGVMLDELLKWADALQVLH
jgi:NAD(P)H-dependent FMN reductase